MTSEWLIRPDGLAARLRSLRAQAGLAGKDLAEAVGWPASKVSRLENGKQMPKASDIQAWAAACQAGDPSTRELLDLLGEVHAVQLDWKHRMRQGQTLVQETYNQLIQGARLIRNFQTTAVPGLLQVADYARRLFTEMVELHGLEVDDVDGAVAARMQRQQVLYDTSKQFEFLLAEPVLRWLLCPTDVMHAQLDRLQTIPDMPNVRFGIVPFGVQLPTTPQNSFQMYDDLVIVDTFTGETTYTGREVDAYANAMGRLWDQAVVGADARQLIIRAAEALRLRT